MIDALHSIGMTDAMITSSVITILICIISILVSRDLQLMPSGVQNVIEMGMSHENGNGSVANIGSIDDSCSRI